MGLRIWRRFKILPGITLNLSKSGISIRFGTRGLGFTIGKRHKQFTIGLPGTGIYYTKRTTRRKK